MSNYKGHITSGAITASLSSVIAYTMSSSMRLGLACGVTTLFFAMFPDVDIKSKFSKFFYWVVLISASYLMLNGMSNIAAFMLILSITPQLVNHRGIFHSNWFAFLVPGYIFYFSYIGVLTNQESLLIYLAGVFGYFTHLFMDSKFVKVLNG